jgi:hypothetical protein
VERLFSKVKRMVPPHRSSLSAERIDQMTLVKENIDAYPSAIHAYRIPPKTADAAHADARAPMEQ